MYTQDFSKAFNHVMLAEVGPWFNPLDPIVQGGLINTKANQRACGYVNDPFDRGGETKFGIAQAACGDSIVVRDLTLDGAQKIYYNQYWRAANCDKMAAPLSLLQFDTAVNMGVSRAAKLLQTALGVVSDGSIGPKTLKAIADCKDLPALCTKYLNLRQARYDAIVAADPSQKKFANGWRNRNEALRAFLGVK